MSERKSEMGLSLRSLPRRSATALGVGLLGTLVFAGAAEAAVLGISSDPFTKATCTASGTTNHQTEVEPDTFGSGSTVVSAFQVGRIFDAARARSASRRRPTTA